MAMLKADSEYRRRWLLFYVAMVVIACPIILWGWPALREYILKQEPSAQIRSFQVLLILLFTPALLEAYHFFYIARQIQASGQYPPPRMKVIRDTEILEGATARRRGHVLVAGSILLTVAALAGTIYGTYVLGKIGEDIGRRHGSGPDSAG